MPKTSQKFVKTDKPFSPVNPSNPRAKNKLKPAKAGNVSNWFNEANDGSINFTDTMVFDTKMALPHS